MADTPDGLKVRITGRCRYPLGATLTISHSSALRLIAEGVAVEADSPAPAIGGEVSASEVPASFLTVRFLKEGLLKGKVFRVEETHARRLIASGAAEEVTI